MADKMGLSLTEHALYKDVIRGPVSYSHYCSVALWILKTLTLNPSRDTA